MTPVQTTKMSNFRWVICALLFLATTVNYMDRQVLSLTWKDFIAVDFHWTDANYGTITGLFSLFYAIANLFSQQHSQSCLPRVALPAWIALIVSRPLIPT